MGDQIENEDRLCWSFGDGNESWQYEKTNIRERTEYLYSNREMSDLSILACDENWWFGDTVKDFTVN